MSPASCKSRDAEVAFELVSHIVPDWSGGTRIGESLEVFNRQWSRRVLGQGAVVLLITDGLDREGAKGLAEATERLRKSCRRLIWLNPLLRYEGFQPRSQGIRAMLPHVDEFRPVHNLQSLRVAGGDAERPAARGPGDTEDGGMSNSEDVLATAAGWRAAGETVALATVVATWGSSPRPAGSRLAVSASGKLAGCVSGGCIEGAVADAAKQTMADRHAAAAGFRHLRRAGLGSRPGLRRQAEGLRGEAVVTPEILAALQAAQAAKRPVALLTRLTRWRADASGPTRRCPARSGRGGRRRRCATMRRRT